MITVLKKDFCDSLGFLLMENFYGFPKQDPG